MTKHVHEWIIWIAGYKVNETCHGDRWIECECGEWRSSIQAEAMLNEYETLKAATERLSAEDARNCLVKLRGTVQKTSAEALRAYADILEGKDA